MSDPTLAVPGTISFWFLLLVFVLHRRFTKNGDDLGSMARLQFFACVSGFISAVGSCISTYNFYSVTITQHFDPITNITISDVTAQPALWCGIEAVTNSFGELSLVLWLLANSVYFLITLRVGTAGHVTGHGHHHHDTNDTLAALATPRWLFPMFQIVVWSVTSVMTILPAIRHIYGPRHYDGESWCWFEDGHTHWEWAQFYGPLIIANLVSIITFSYSLITLGSFNDEQTVVIDDPEAMEAAGLTHAHNGNNGIAAGGYVAGAFVRTESIPIAAATSSLPSSPKYVGDRTSSGSSSASTAYSSAASDTSSIVSGGMSDEELVALEFHHRRSIRRLFYRLALQNGVLFVVFVPDAVVYYIETYSSYNAPWILERLALYLWKCEGFAVALLWLSNSQVQIRMNQMEWYVSFMDRYIRPWYGRACCRCCKRRQRVPLASQVTMARPAYYTQPSSSSLPSSPESRNGYHGNSDVEVKSPASTFIASSPTMTTPNGNAAMPSLSLYQPQTPTGASSSASVVSSASRAPHNGGVVLV